MTDLKKYYDLRAPIYDEVYHRNEPERNAELAMISGQMHRLFGGRNVLEIACGTGYWTATLAEVARQVLATDTSPRMLELAEQRLNGLSNVKLQLADAYDLSGVEGTFDGAVANFWLSHVPMGKIGMFLNSLHRKLEPGSVAFMSDNLLVPGVGGEVVEGPTKEDGYKHRTLPDGSEHIVVKNYYTRKQLSDLFSDYHESLEIDIGKYYWWIKYELI